MVQRVAAPGGDEIMTLAQSGIRNYEYLVTEAHWLNSLLTENAKEDGTSIICNVDSCNGNIDTLRQVEHEAKFALNDSFHIKTGQLLQKKIEYENNPNKKFVLWGYGNHMRNTPSDSIWVKDLVPLLSSHSQYEILKKFGARGLDFPLRSCTHTLRQLYNTFFDDWTKGRIDDFDLSTLETTSPPHKFFYD